MMLVGWPGMAALVFFTLPTIGPRWLFFFFLALALTGTALPLAALLNLRFPTTPPAGSQVVMRQSLWLGIYFPILGWLQFARVLTPAMALLLLVGLAIIEWLLRLREISQWKPEEQ
jgi:hypothetical protein